MRLFAVPPGARVRITSRLVRWVEGSAEIDIAQDITWEGTTTDRYYYYKGARRRLIVKHTMMNWPELGIWQRDCECEIVS